MMGAFLAQAPTLRRRWYAAAGRQHRLARPVISVGNLAFGGRGKTPTVAYLAKLLVAAGERPAILTRGYARQRPEDGVVVVSDGVHLRADVERSGDEPLMLARDVPRAIVCVSENRLLAGVLAERALGATVHLLDDGFQHLQLARDIDLVLLTTADLALAAPIGRLREPRAALAAADALIVDSAGDDDALRTAHRAPRTATFTLHRSLGRPVPLEPDRPEVDAQAPVIAVAGIAEPARFFRALTASGWSLAQTLAFRDHHPYTARDMQRIADAARQAGGAVVVTTTKDAMRLLPLRPFPVPVLSVPLDVTIEPAEEFRTWMIGRLREARG